MASPVVNYSHPYYPRTLPLPHYRENTLPIQVVLAAVVASFAVTYAATWALVGRDRFGRRLRTGERAVLCWFGMSGCIHVVIEGYLTLTSHTIAGGNSLLAQICKYSTSNQEMFCIATLSRQKLVDY